MAALSSEAFYKPEETYNMRVNMGKSIGESLKVFLKLLQAQDNTLQIRPIRSS